MQTRCPKCQTAIEFPEAVAAEWTVCPHCVAPIQIPKDEAAEAAKEAAAVSDSDISQALDDAGKKKGRPVVVKKTLNTISLDGHKKVRRGIRLLLLIILGVTAYFAWPTLKDFFPENVDHSKEMLANNNTPQTPGATNVTAAPTAIVEQGALDEEAGEIFEGFLDNLEKTQKNPQLKDRVADLVVPPEIQDSKATPDKRFVWFKKVLQEKSMTPALFEMYFFGPDVSPERREKELRNYTNLKNAADYPAFRTATHLLSTGSK